MQKADQLINDIYLTAKIGTLHLGLLPHFLNHYITEVGILPKNVLLTIHHNDISFNNLDKAMKILDDFRIKPFAIWNGSFNQLGLMYYLTKMTTSVPLDKWIVLADVDELNFKDVPVCQLVKECEANHYDYVASDVVDRVSEKGIIELQEFPSLWEQFPHESRLTNYIGLGFQKMILIRPHVFMQNGGFHKPSYHFAKFYSKHPVVQKTYHFKWHGDILEKSKSYNTIVNKHIRHYLQGGNKTIVSKKPILFYPRVFTAYFKDLAYLSILTLKETLENYCTK